MTGPERREHEQARAEPYGRPGDAPSAGAAAPTNTNAAGDQAAPPPAAAASVGLDAATQAAIQAAAAAAAAAAIQAQQARAAAAARQLPVAAAAAAGGAAPGLPSAMPGLPGFIKVSGQSDPRKVAGKLAHTVRENPAPAMLTIGSQCINQAVKAIAIARGVCARLRAQGRLACSVCGVGGCGSWVCAGQVQGRCGGTCTHACACTARWLHA
jgi:stage V sporulation protein SpoVS